MSRLRVVPIVEGHGEVEAVRILLERLWYEMLEGDWIDVLRPIRIPRTRLVKPGSGAGGSDELELERGELASALQLADLRLREREDDVPALVLLLLDGNGDPPCVLAPKLVAVAAEETSHLDFACVLAHQEYETWFVACAESLDAFLEVSSETGIPDDPEAAGSKKGWVESRRIGHYSETVDQPAMTRRMDVELARRRSPSFDKLCRELEARLEG